MNNPGLFVPEMQFGWYIPRHFGKRCVASLRFHRSLIYLHKGAQAERPEDGNTMTCVSAWAAKLLLCRATDRPELYVFVQHVHKYSAVLYVKQTYVAHLHEKYFMHPGRAGKGASVFLPCLVS